jgi:RNA 3'-terminal phosphate cyclase (ATP)
MGQPVSIDADVHGEATLLTALGVALATGRPFVLRRFRASAEQPGLRSQHLALLRAAGALCGERPALEVGSLDVPFLTDGPRGGGEGEGSPVRPGDYVLDVGAGVSVPALLACLAPGLALAGGGSLLLRGGTHLADGPLFHALPFVWLPGLRAYGFDADLRLRTAGFAPEGGGEVRAAIPPYGGGPPALVELPARGTLLEAHATALVAGPSLPLAERLAGGAEAALRERGIPCMRSSLPLPSARGQGAAVLVRAHFEHTVAAFGAAALPGEAPEETGRRAAAGLCALMEGPGAVDGTTAELLLLPAALLAAGRLGPSRPATTRFQAPGLTPALRGAAEAVRQLLPVDVALGEDGALQLTPRA